MEHTRFNSPKLNATVTPSNSTPSPSINVTAVEKLLNYTFKDKGLIEKALTHSSYTGACSYERLEFIGDATLGLAVSNHLYLAYGDGDELNAGQMSLLRSANVSTEKLARVAVKWGFFKFVRHNATALDHKVREFAEAVAKEDELSAIYGGSVKAPKVLADIVESVAAAIYVDLNFNLEAQWVVFRRFLEPIIGPEDLQQQPQPVIVLFELCQKHGKKVDFKHWKNGDKTVFSVYLDGEFTASGSSEQREIAKLNAAKEALVKLNATIFKKPEVVVCMNGNSEIEEAKHELQQCCLKRRWSKPEYKIEKDEGIPQEKKYVCSVQVGTQNGVLCMIGDERPKINKAQNSAASLMLLSLQQSGYI